MLRMKRRITRARSKARDKCRKTGMEPFFLFIVKVKFAWEQIKIQREEYRRYRLNVS